MGSDIKYASNPVLLVEFPRNGLPIGYLAGQNEKMRPGRKYTVHFQKNIDWYRK